jgi:molybdopterin converting factor subunit 1
VSVALVHVRYFAAAREAAGTDGESLRLDDATVAGLRAALERRHPGLATLGKGLRFAVGERFAAGDAPLDDGATVALIPPVSGG